MDVQRRALALRVVRALPLISLTHLSADLSCTRHLSWPAISRSGDLVTATDCSSVSGGDGPTLLRRHRVPSSWFCPPLRAGTRHRLTCRLASLPRPPVRGRHSLPMDGGGFLSSEGTPPPNTIRGSRSARQLSLDVEPFARIRSSLAFHDNASTLLAADARLPANLLAAAAMNPVELLGVLATTATESRLWS